MSQGISLNKFRDYRANDDYSDTSYLKWKKRGRIFVAIHTLADVYPIWRHNLPRIQRIEKDGVERHEVWSNRINCPEHDETIKRQYRRDKETGRRDYPVSKCPVCLLIDNVYERLSAGEFNTGTSLFRWEGDDPSHTRVLHAAGLLNMRRDRMSPREQEALDRARVAARDMWKENAMAKCEYLFRVVDIDDPEAGVQVALESKLIGDKMIDVINKRCKSIGEERGDISKYPVVFEWEYNDQAREISKKYDVTAIEAKEIPEEVMRLIREDPPSVGHLLKEHNWAQLRLDLETHALVEFPWDEIFGKVEKADLDSKYGAPEAEPDLDAAAQEAFGDLREGVADVVEQPVTSDSQQVEMYDCDVCGAQEVMGADDFKCPNCGAEYDQGGNVVSHPGYSLNDKTGRYEKLAPPSQARRGGRSRRKGPAPAPVQQDLDAVFEGDDIPWGDD